MTNGSRWYALTVRHQHERQTERALQSKGWETLVPVYMRRSRWSDRVKDVEWPLFSGYVLCSFPLSDRIRVVDTPGVAKIVGFGGTPAAVEQREIEEIRLVVASELPMHPWPYLKTGDRVRVDRGPQEMSEAGKKTIEIMRASPYQKTANAGLFLKALSGRSSALPRLLAANLGNQVANASALERLAEFTASAPDLEANKLEQIAALPLGSRIKVNPWNDEITLIKTRPIALLSPREKMPFEVTPFVLYLTQ